MNKKILLVGNCHIFGIARCLDNMIGSEVHRISMANNEKWLEQVSEVESGIDIIGVISSYKDEFLAAFPLLSEKTVTIPHIQTRLFHPDCCTVKYKGEMIRTLLGVHHSAIACFGYINGLTVMQTLSLYNYNIYNHLGYIDNYRISTIKWAKFQEEETGWPVLSLYEKWKKMGCYMLTFNHPRLFVLADIARLFVKINNIDVEFDNPDFILRDDTARHEIWPVYPEIAEIFSFEGNYQFKLADSVREEYGIKKLAISLEEFVKDSFQRYSKLDVNEIIFDTMKTGEFETLKNSDLVQKVIGKSSKIITINNPYRKLPDSRFWRRAVATRIVSEVDPVVSAKFLIKKEDKVATAGSCFAQHISGALKANGFGYYVAERADSGIKPAEALKRNYGVYSARYGNIYTAKQLLQLLNRVDGTFVPTDEAWQRYDGRFIDPFRPQIDPEGFGSLDELIQSRNHHFNSVKVMLENLDVFVFTLGLTEAWVSKRDGAVFPLTPGAVGAVNLGDDYEFHNFTCNEVKADMEGAIKIILAIRPNAKILLTVSPVPLVATYEKRHVLVSTIYSKSVLRVVADELSREFGNVAYFPSYEIITGNFNRGKYYDDDLRTVTKDGVAHVMKLLIQHYTANTDMSVSERDVNDARIICDEEILDY